MTLYSTDKSMITQNWVLFYLSTYAKYKVMQYFFVS